MKISDEYIDHLIHKADLHETIYYYHKFDRTVIENIVNVVLHDNLSFVNEYINGNKTVYNKLVGEVLKSCKGVLNSVEVNKILTELLDLVDNSKKVIQ